MIVGGVRDVDAVVAGQAGEAGVPALADGAELPFVTAQVQLPEDHRCLRAGGGDLESDARLAGPVEQVQGEVGDVSESHTIGRVQARDDDNGSDLRREGLQVDRHPILGPLPATSCP